MNKLKVKIKSAKKKWEELQNNKVPIIYVGAASCGKAAGALELISEIERFLKDSNLEARVMKVGCIGPCYLEPLVDIKMPEQPRVSYSNVTPKLLTNILKSHLAEGIPLAKAAIGHFGDNSFHNIPPFYELPMLKPQVRVVLRNCGLIDPEDIDQYLAVDGYQGIMNALRMTPEDVIGVVRQAGMRGRGGAGFPTFRKWTVCRGAPGEQKYLICNADEGEPRGFYEQVAH
jgi:NADH-quinone oxidoreductase subunit F